MSNNYNSNDGFRPGFWGPPLWFFLHCISFNYPVKPTRTEKQSYFDFIHTLPYVLPCRLCREHLEIEIAYNFTFDVMKNRESFSKWMHQLHNSINKKLNKKEHRYEHVRDVYETYRHKDKDETGL
jgi:hypothetical protein